MRREQRMGRRGVRREQTLEEMMAVVSQRVGSAIDSVLMPGMDFCIVICPMGAGQAPEDVTRISISNFDPKRQAEILRAQAAKIERDGK